MPTIKPFANESDSLSLDGLTIENRMDRINLYGRAALTLDKSGYKTALALKKLIDATCEAMAQHEKAGTLPDVIAVAPTDSVANPFGPTSS